MVDPRKGVGCTPSFAGSKANMLPSELRGDLVSRTNNSPYIQVHST